ncbi:MAG: CCA tRNA nucleotidyltransferase [Bacteroidales bacterium]|jgi:poly(A) polymerase|nr:CCA tRNA nucleotidyltransferase [Bacteroidales bacterium]
MKKFLTDSIFRLISREADKLGQPCYVIGGYVRDLLLQRPSKDIDIVTVGSSMELARRIAKQLGRGASVQVFKNFGTAQVKSPDGDYEIEFVGARRESYQRNSRKPIVEDGSLEDDQQRRDFTINALAICLNKEQFGMLTDPFDGIGDIERKIIRTPLEPGITFSDDPLRMLRAIRFATQLEFYIDEPTFQAIADNRERIGIISQERIIDELNKIVMSLRPSRGFLLLDKCGLLKLIFPELCRMKGIETVGSVGHKDNFRHTLEVLDRIAPHTQNLWLRWAALLHDIGKPRTKRFDPATGWTFYGHNVVGERMVPKIFERLKLPLNEKMKFVQKMVALHMRPIVLSEEEVTDSAVRRLLFEAGDDIDELMTLCEADITSKNSDKVKRYMDNFRLVREKLKDLEERDHIRTFQPPVSGTDIMEVFGIAPGPKIGLLKSAIKDAILDGQIHNNYDEAFGFMLLKAAEIGLTPVKAMQ